MCKNSNLNASFIIFVAMVIVVTVRLPRNDKWCWAGVTLDTCQGLLWDPLKLGKGFPIIAQQTVKVTDLVKQSALLLSFCEIGKMTFDLRRGIRVLTLN